MSEAVDERFAGLRFIQFNLNVNPADLPTSQQKGVRIIKVHGRMMPMFYEKKNVKDAHTLLKYSMEKHRPNDPMHGPIALSVEYLFPYPKGTPKCRQIEGAPMVQRPDVDNIQKLFQDVMTEMGFWDDDSQIWKLTLVKRRTVIEPMIKVSVWQTGEADGKRQ